MASDSRCCGNRPTTATRGPTSPSPTTSRRRTPVSRITSGRSRSRSTGRTSWRTSTRQRHDDYSAIIVKALADRLAEAFAEWLHQQVRRSWYAPDENLGKDDLVAERYRGIRPAYGYPACPDHSEKKQLFALLDAGRAGLELTESYAMSPAAAVSGLYFAHPKARYFSIGRIGQDQLEDYAARKQMTPEEAERWLRPHI